MYIVYAFLSCICICTCICIIQSLGAGALPLLTFPGGRETPDTTQLKPESW